MESLFGKTLQEIKDIIVKFNMPSYSAIQICDWLYKKGATDISEMTNLSKKYRETLSQTYSVGRSNPSTVQCSADGTKKYLYNFNDKSVEAVYIPDGERATLCVSSQAGCRMGCKFCMTGRQKFKGNLTACEILTQIRNLPEFEKLTNIVYMGMGEPMDNIDEVLKSLEIMTAEYAYAWSPKRITVSTIGVKNGLKRFLDESSCHLAISLHNPFNTERLALMPAENSFSVAEAVNLVKQYDFTGQRRVSFEYIMFNGLNDTVKHADALVKMLNGLECRVNLIRFHKIPDSDLAPSSEKTIESFKSRLNSKGLLTTVRSSRGEDIFAACGMLSASESNTL